MDPVGAPEPRYREIGAGVASRRIALDINLRLGSFDLERKREHRGGLACRGHLVKPNSQRSGAVGSPELIEVGLQPFHQACQLSDQGLRVGDNAM